MGVVLLVSLVIWQLFFLIKNQNLKTDLNIQQRQSVLMASAVSLRRIETRRKEVRLSPLLKRNVVDSILRSNFSNVSGKMEWGFFDGKGIPVDSLNGQINKDKLSLTTYRICLSCLTNIDVLDEQGSRRIDQSFVLNQTPAQMMDIRGIDQSTFVYLHVAFEKPALSYTIFVLPLLFILGLVGLFLWLIKTNIKQAKLIQQKNEFVNHLSHQFQTPISSIKLSAKLLSNLKIAKKEELVKIIQLESTRLENHIKTVLNWVKSDADRLYLHKKSVYPSEIISRSINQMLPIFLEYGTIISFIEPTEDIEIYTDAEHLQLVLYNIFDNSIKHNERPVEIKISCLQIPNYNQISISDNGIGLLSKEKELTFKGLGLSYIQNIMKAHAGSLEWKSDKSGFTVYLNFPLHV